MNELLLLKFWPLTYHHASQPFICHHHLFTLAFLWSHTLFCSLAALVYDSTVPSESDFCTSSHGFSQYTTGKAIQETCSKPQCYTECILIIVFPKDFIPSTIKKAFTDTLRIAKLANVFSMNHSHYTISIRGHYS